MALRACLAASPQGGGAHLGLPGTHSASCHWPHGSELLSPGTCALSHPVYSVYPLADCVLRYQQGLRGYFWGVGTLKRFPYKLMVIAFRLYGRFKKKCSTFGQPETCTSIF